ncbi:MAG TPA: hypothetical protein VFR37_00925 [Longimicrobium sp.]|nr:hypothetical protein [Longimicrobium sp.]
MARNGGGAARAMDRVLFLKNGYSLWMHAVPFGVAALLLLVFSLAADDPLRRLVDVLSRPNWLWIPAILLTAVSALVYLLTIRYQVRRAYLWPQRVLLRTLATATLYLALAFGGTYGVWRLSVPDTDGWGARWACLVLALLSLAGLGWTMPKGWIDDIGVRSPDYLRAHALARELARVLGRVRGTAIGRRQDVARVEEVLGALRDEIEENVEREPAWAAEQPRAFSERLHTLLLAIEAGFATETAIADFPAALKGQKKHLYRAFTEAMEEVVDQWPAWRHDPQGDEP